MSACAAVTRSMSTRSLAELDTHSGEASAALAVHEEVCGAPLSTQRRVGGCSGGESFCRVRGWGEG